jgi:threonine/homoserine/homoserine lactone efflux protein
VICYVSIASWALGGSFLQQYLRAPQTVRLFNRSMAAMLILSVIYLIAG